MTKTKMENKFAIIEIGEGKIEEGKQINQLLKALGERTDWYIFKNIEDYDMDTEVKDLEEFYAGLYFLI